MRPFIRAFCLAAALAAPLPALAVVRGEVVREPDGIRGSVVRVESSRGELCSGALVAPDLVLTAAHCVTDVAAYRVVAVDRGFRPVRLGVAGIALHPAFVPGTTPRTQPGIDLALLKLDRSLDAGFRPFDLREAGRIGRGDGVELAGFGITGEGRASTARTLRRTTLVSLGTLKVANDVIVVADAERLAETTGAGACRGDSGGPILRPTGAGYQLLGIVSWSSGALETRVRSACGGFTAVTPVAEHLGWIASGAASLQAAGRRMEYMGR